MGSMNKDQRIQYRKASDDYIVSRHMTCGIITAGMVTEALGKLGSVIVPDVDEHGMISLPFRNGCKSRKVCASRFFAATHKKVSYPMFVDIEIYVAVKYGEKETPFDIAAKKQNKDSKPLKVRKEFRGIKEIAEILCTDIAVASNTTPKMPIKAKPGVPSRETFMNDLYCLKYKVENDEGIIPTDDYFLERYGYQGNRGIITTLCFWIYMLSNKKTNYISDGNIDSGVMVFTKDLYDYLPSDVLS